VKGEILKSAESISAPFAKGSICGLNVYTDLACIRPTVFLKTHLTSPPPEVDTVEKEEVA
jgi:hypothetical protein